MVGSVLGNRYRILREVGAGGMAKVYLAEDITANELVAVKVLYPQFSQDISFVQRFSREAKLASTLTDPHIVRVLDYGADRDLQYLVMEYVEGQELNGKLKEKGIFEWKYALEITDQLATALEHAHSHGVVHRDIKPQNLMLNDDGLLKVLDFGIARIPTLPSLTQSGFIGSPYYASPEQAMGEEVDIRSDIYSAGIVLYELLSGATPFDAKSPWSIISQHITTEPPPIQLPDADIPEDVQKLVRRMLAKRPEERFQTPAALRQAIATVLAGQPILDDFQTAQPGPNVHNAALIESLCQRAHQAVEAQEWARAVDLLSQASQLDPHNKEITEKLVTVERRLQLDSLYKAGSRAVDNRRWEEAINHFNVIVELDPGYKDTEELLTSAHEALKTENKQQFIATRYQEGVAHFQAERWQEAIEALTEVHQVNPNYERVQHFLAEAGKQGNPTWSQKLIQPLTKRLPVNAGRWGLITAGIVTIAILSFLAFGTNSQVSGDDDVKERLKMLYEEVQQSVERGNRSEALAKLELILTEDPDYADAATIKRELLAELTPGAASGSEKDPLEEMIENAQEAIDLGLWAEAVDILTELRTRNTEYQDARVSSLLCDAYVGRGVENLASIRPTDNQIEIVELAVSDFQTGTLECPKRIDLADQLQRATAYLEALNTPASNYELLIPILAPIVAANPNYAGGNAKQMLYNAYIDRAQARRGSPELAAVALSDYEAALALNVDDPGEAQIQRAELLLSFGKQSTLTISGEEETAKAAAILDSNESQPTPDDSAAKATPSPAIEPGRLKYSQPLLIGPADDTIFAGEFAEVFLEWQPVGELAENEYYDLTIMHLFAGEPRYTGSTRTRDTRVKINADIGVGEAGEDRFYWWVTVRQDNTAPSPGELDISLSPRSEPKTFIWSR